MGNKGFTLIEVLMVVVIIGILASIALPQYAQFTSKAKVSEAVGVASAIRSAEEIYKMQFNAFSADLAGAGFTAPTMKYWGAPTYTPNSPSAGNYTVKFVMTGSTDWIQMVGSNTGTVSWSATPSYLAPQ